MNLLGFPLENLELFFGFITQPDQDRLNTVVGTYLRDHYCDAKIEAFGQVIFFMVMAQQVQVSDDHLLVLSKLRSLAVTVSTGVVESTVFHEFMRSLSPSEAYCYFTMTGFLTIGKIEMN